MDEKFATIRRAPFPEAEGRRADPKSTYGRLMAAVCPADDPPPVRTITAANWMDAAARR